MLSYKNIFVNSKGFTIIELTIAMSIFVTLAIIGGDFIIRGFKSISFGTNQETAVSNARRGMEIITKEIREARRSNRGDYTLAVIEEQNFIFYADDDNDGDAEKIRFFLDLNENTIKKTVTEPGAYNDYSGTGSTTLVVSYVNNQEEPIFSYFDGNNNETNAINNIRLVNVNLKINVNPAIAPQDYYVETDIQLRNLKDNL